MRRSDSSAPPSAHSAMNDSRSSHSPTPTGAADVLVVGGGVIGAAVALELTRRGVRVTVLERGAAGRETSAVAAGMLSPQAEADGPSPFLDLGLACRARYADWVRSVSEESGMAIDYEPTRVLNLALTPDRVTELKARRDWQLPLGLEAEWLSGAEARRLERILAPDLPGALLLPGEARVDSAALSLALVAAARARGARVEEGVAVTALALADNRVTGVLAGERRYPTGAVVIAAGAWSSRIRGVPLPADWVEPRRGQILNVRLRSHTLGHVLYTHGAYVVPRSGGELIVGTTVERAGFERVTTAGGLRSIVAAVSRYAPAIEEAEIVSVNAGLRPESHDGLPLIGPHGRVDGLVFATGHFRNGILLAPLTGELVAESIVSGRLPDALRPFLPERVSVPWPSTARS